MRDAALLCDEPRGKRVRGGGAEPNLRYDSERMKRHLYLLCGWAALALGAVGALLPLLPTVPFVILAAFCFARSSPKLEQWLLNHRHFGAHIAAWRDKGAISKRGKKAALLTFIFSIMISAIFAPWPWVLAPVAALMISGTWIWTRPEP